MKIKLGQALKYEQPTKYIVSSEKYNDEYLIPVLTAGKSFILGYTNEEDGIYNNLPVIIFDDFTTETKYVDFPFKVKSSAMKMLRSSNNEYNLKYFYYLINFLNFQPTSHKRHWISKFSELEFDIPEREKQDQIVEKLDKLNEIQSKKIIQLKKYNELIKSQFIEMFGDVNTNPKHWEMTKLQNICSSIVRGPFGSALKKDFFVEKNDTTYKVYEQKNAIQKSEKLGTYYISKEKYKELKRFECKPNDFIMSCSGTMGELYQLPDGSEKGIINQALCKFTLNGKMNSIVFLEFMKNAIKNIETKGSGIQNIASVIYIKNLNVYVPPIELQNKFAEIVKHIDKLKFSETITKLKNLCYNVFNVIQSKNLGEVKNDKL